VLAIPDWIREEGEFEVRLANTGEVLVSLGVSSRESMVAGDVVKTRVTAATPWREASLVLGRGDAATAADIFGEVGARPFEAEARLIAAKGGQEADLPAAIQFFREVGALAYLAEAEALLATSRSA
jgi:hypothetical protein